MPTPLLGASHEHTRGEALGGCRGLRGMIEGIPLIFCAARLVQASGAAIAFALQILQLQAVAWV